MSLFKRESDQSQPPAPSYRQTRSTTDLVVKPMLPTDLEPEPMEYVRQPEAPVRANSSATSLPRETAAVLDGNTRLNGTLHSEGNVLIEGSFEGEMEARETILVEKDASAKGQLMANDVIISGLFDGEAVCQGQFRVTPTGSITGEINTRILVVDEGSTVNCRFIMSRTRR